MVSNEFTVWSFLENARDVDETLRVHPDYLNPFIECGLSRAIANFIIEARKGVGVLLAPQGSGKTTRIKVEAHKAYKSGILSGVIYGQIAGAQIDANQLMKQAIGFHDAQFTSVAALVEAAMQKGKLDKTLAHSV